VALVDDDEIEEVPGVLAVQARSAFVAGDALIGREIHVAARGGFSPGYLVAGVPERAEILRHRIVDEDVAIGEEEHLRTARGAFGVPARGPELPGDPERDGGLARAGAQVEQDTPAAGEDASDRAVDGGLLIVAERPGPIRPNRRQQLLGRRGVRRTLRPALPPPDLVGRRKGADGPLHAGRVVHFDDGDAVRRVGEREPERLGVVTRLLEAVSGMPVAGLRLDDGNGEVAPIPEEVVGALAPSAAGPAAGEHDAAVGEGALLFDCVRRLLPARPLEHGNDELAAGVGFGVGHLRGRWGGD